MQTIQPRRCSTFVAADDESEGKALYSLNERSEYVRTLAIRVATRNYIRPSIYLPGRIFYL